MVSCQKVKFFDEKWWWWWKVKIFIFDMKKLKFYICLLINLRYRELENCISSENLKFWLGRVLRTHLSAFRRQCHSFYLGRATFSKKVKIFENFKCKILAWYFTSRALGWRKLISKSKAIFNGFMSKSENFSWKMMMVMESENFHFLTWKNWNFTLYKSRDRELQY